MDNETLHKTILFDFYGELLTDKQREYFDLYHNEDLSLSEIAEKAGITRHGVYDVINRAEKILLKTEEKTGIVKKWMDTREEIDEAIKLAEKIKQQSDGSCKELASELINKIKKINV